MANLQLLPLGTDTEDPFMSWLAKILGASCSRPKQPTGKSPLELLSAGAVLIDVRSAGEFGAGHIEGALWLPLERVHLDIANVVPSFNQPLILYCRSGARSGRACAIVAQMGYDNATNGGGIGALAQALDRPVVGRR